MDIIPYLPNNIKHLNEKKWFGGIFINPYGLLQSTATGEFLRNPMLNFYQEVDDDDAGSCILAVVNDDGTVGVKNGSCIDQHYFLCEQIPEVQRPVAIKKEFHQLMKEETTKKFYNHTTNSLSACAAFCGVSKVAFRGTDCACIEYSDDSIEKIQECHQILPCPGNILQPCGCKLDDDLIYPIVMPLNSTSLPQFEFSSCIDLRKQGVLMDNAFINGTNTTLDCKLWSKFIY